MTIPVGKRLWFYTGGKTGYYILNNGIELSIYDHDNNNLLSLLSSRVPTINNGISLATATPPQEYDLPLTDGITGYAKYSKDQFGQVLITLQEIQKSDGSKLGNINIETLGALPVGYRPCRGINTAAVATNIEGVPIHGIYQLWIDESGAVKCYGQYGVEATMLRGILIFQAQN